MSFSSFSSLLYGGLNLELVCVGFATNCLWKYLREMVCMAMSYLLLSKSWVFISSRFDLCTLCISCTKSWYQETDYHNNPKGVLVCINTLIYIILFILFFWFNKHCLSDIAISLPAYLISKGIYLLWGLRIGSAWQRGK